jgi:hypothetical protein
MRSLSERFWNSVSKSGACWEWQGNRDACGYGFFRLGTKMRRAHRVAYLLTHGQWPRPCCLHSCDNPPCCNPAHLREGTPSDNQQDAVRRGRSRLGPAQEAARIANTRIPVSLVETFIGLADILSAREMSRLTEVSQSQISRILRGQSRRIQPCVDSGAGPIAPYGGSRL